MDIKDKQFVGIIGPNGSGKSTFLKCIYRVLKPSGGVVFLDGKAIDQYSYKDSAKKQAVVAQHNNVNFDFTVMDIVLMGRSPHKKMLERDNAKDYEIAENALDAVNLRGFETRNFVTLSGGEQQRVILARAIAQKTDCMILDEPTNHLDINYQLGLLTIVKQLNITVLTAMHDLNIAAKFCDYLYVMQDGKVIADGPTRKLLTPGLIKKVYGIRATVKEDEYGFLQILYHPEKNGRF